MANYSSKEIIMEGKEDIVCEEYRHNISVHQYIPINPDSLHVPLDYTILPIICIFGILGNILNLVVLSRKHMKSSLNRMEHSVYMGLMSLAASDMIQCMFILTLIYTLPHHIKPPKLTFLEQVHEFFYSYSSAFCNMLLFNSTWLTVLMAIGRYIAICHPMNARSFVKVRVTCILILATLCMSVLLSLPYFWQFEIQEYKCSGIFFESSHPPNCECTINYRQPRSTHANLLTKYHYFWMVIVFIVPLLVLIVCNICLIRSLRESYRMQREHRANQARDPSLRITPTLVAIIVLFIVLISPAEILKFIPATTWNNPNTERIVKSCSNILQALNAAVNFILYCAINVHFRNTMKQVFFCMKERRNIMVLGSMRSEQIRTNHTTILSDAETEL